MAVIEYEGPKHLDKETVAEDELRYNEETGHWEILLDQAEDGSPIVQYIPRERVIAVTRNEH